MKHFIMMLALIATMITAANAQPVRGTYGTVQQYTVQPGAINAYILGVITPVSHPDTLVNVDTGLVRFTFNNNLDFLFDFSVTKISGTVGGAALLQGSNDKSTWNTLTGNTTYCASCIGASATVTNTTGTKHYQWYIPHSATNYLYYQVQVISTGTMTATYNASTSYKY